MRAPRTRKKGKRDTYTLRYVYLPIYSICFSIWPTLSERERADRLRSKKESVCLVTTMSCPLVLAFVVTFLVTITVADFYIYRFEVRGEDGDVCEYLPTYLATQNCAR